MRARYWTLAKNARHTVGEAIEHPLGTEAAGWMSCVSRLRPDGAFDLVLSLRGLTIEREISHSEPGDEEQVTEWRQMYEALGFNAVSVNPHSSLTCGSKTLHPYGYGRTD